MSSNGNIQLGNGTLKAMVFVLLILMLQGKSVKAQDLVSGRTFYDVSFDFSSSGNGHGAFFAPGLVYNTHYNAFTAAPLVYASDRSLSGLKLSYARNLSGKVKDDYEIVCLTKADSLDFAELLYFKKTHRDLLQINFYTYLQYNKPTNLSDDFAEYESLTNAEKDVNWRDVKVSTAELGMGVQLQYNITALFACKFYAGLSAFHHFENEHQLQNGRESLSLNLGLTALYTFDVLHQKSKKAGNHR